MEEEEEGNADKVIQAITTLSQQVSEIAQGQQELWAELDRRTTIDPGSLALAQKLEQVHNDLRWLLGLVGAVTHPGGGEGQQIPDEEEGEG